MKKILVIRNDKIGDFMVAWPAFAMLKQSLPDAKIIALVPEYTADLARVCPYLDDIILDNEDKKDPRAYQQLLNKIKSEQFDAVISFVSTWYNAKLTWQSGIKYRLAPATKLFQFLYNHRLTQRRSQSRKAEFEYNLDLVRAFLTDLGLPMVEAAPPYLTFTETEKAERKQQLAEKLKLDPTKKWLFVHSGTGGSANSLSLEQFTLLINQIQQHFACEVVLTAGNKAEQENAEKLAKMLEQSPAIYADNDGLADFALSLACADLFIAGSTGPLHIAGGVNIATIGFYPSRLSAIPRRWQPINQPDKHLAFSAPEGKATQMNLTLISIPDSLADILPFIQKQWQASH